jgi:hypothetical protein
MNKHLNATTKQAIGQVFDRLDYKALGSLYCDEGGEAFWRAKRGLCQKLGIQFANLLLERLPRNGQSLYVGAGVAEIPVMAVETLDLQRTVQAYNLRTEEVEILSTACHGRRFQFVYGDAAQAAGPFDHVWIVSVLNDPERFPELSALSYGRANPVTFQSDLFVQERAQVLALADACLSKLTLPGLVTTSVEEIPWITNWCATRGVTCVVEEEDYPTAIVEDPICFVRVGEA